MGFKRIHKNLSSYNITKVKDVLNCILENGAYSDKNYNIQMAKKSNNYNENEKLLVTLSYRFKKFEGEKLQNQLIEFFATNKEFLDYIKNNDIELYRSLKELIPHGSRF